MNDASPGGWYYVIRVSPEGRPDPDTGPDGPMTFDEAMARETTPDAMSGWRSVPVSVLTATGASASRDAPVADGPPITMCANCDLPVTDQGRYASGSSTGWAHWGFWQGVRCPRRLTGAQPGRKISWDDYQDWLSDQLVKR